MRKSRNLEVLLIGHSYIPWGNKDWVQPLFHMVAAFKISEDVYNLNKHILYLTSVYPFHSEKFLIFELKKPDNSSSFTCFYMTEIT